MAYRIVYARRANADLDRLEQFIASESPRQANTAILRILRGLENLKTSPELGKPLADGYRQLNLRYGRSGYVIRYRVVADVILITRIWHGLENRPR